MIFQLHIFIGTGLERVIHYPYILVSAKSDIHVHVTYDHINFFYETHSDYNELDYLPTSRFIDINLNHINQLIFDSIQQDDYELMTWEEPEKRFIVGYYTYPECRFLQREFVEDITDPGASKLTAQLAPIMQHIQVDVLNMPL